VSYEFPNVSFIWYGLWTTWTGRSHDFRPQSGHGMGLPIKNDVNYVPPNKDVAETVHLIVKKESSYAALRISGQVEVVI
jgi:hypothetical protein